MRSKEEKGKERRAEEPSRREGKGRSNSQQIPACFPPPLAVFKRDMWSENSPDSEPVLWGRGTEDGRGLTAVLHHRVHRPYLRASSLTFPTGETRYPGGGVRNNVSLPQLKHYNAWEAGDYVGELARQKHRGPNNSGRSPWHSCLLETKLWRGENDSITTRHKAEKHEGGGWGRYVGGSDGGTWADRERVDREIGICKAPTFDYAHAALQCCE